MPDPRVDAYLANLPAGQRELLEAVRAQLAAHAPDAEETIAYGMPALRLDGRFLLSFAAWKRHCTIYPIDDALLERHAAEVRGHTRTRGGLHFTAERPLPPALLADLVRGRVAAVRGGRY